MRKLNLIIIVLVLFITACGIFELSDSSDYDGYIPPPESFEINQISPSSCKLTWSAQENPEIGYKIDRLKDSEEWEEDYEIFGVNVFEFIDNDLQAGSTYVYKLYYYSGQTILYYDYVSITIQFPAPIDLNITGLSLTSCKLEWVDNSEGEDGFIIDRRKDEDYWETNYSILGENSQSFYDYDLETGSIYQYRIYAYLGECVSSSISDEIFMTYLPPESLIFNQTSYTELEISWNYTSSGGEAGFTLKRRLSGDSWRVIAEMTMDDYTYIDTDLFVGEEYDYMVYAYSSQMDGNANIQSIDLETVFNRFAWVVGDTYQMGNPEDDWDDDEYPPHSVTVGSFIIGQYEVTQEEYLELMPPPYYNYPDPYIGGDNYPAFFIDWFEAVQYCNARSINEGYTPCYDISDWSCDYEANGYRLPTEAEWEYAARGGKEATEYFYYSGSNCVDSVAICYPNEIGGVSEVGALIPNDLGIYDMSGNAPEWCNDWYDSDYYSYSPQINPKGPENGTHKVKRGGGCYSFSHSCRVVNRDYVLPDTAHDFSGFRIVRAIP